MIRPELTVAAVIEGNVDEGQQPGQFLLVEEKVRGQAVFNQPAGHVEDAESPLEAVVREVSEETAWEFVPRFLIGAYLWKSPRTADHILRIAFAGQVRNHDAGAALDDGILAAHWMSVEDIRQSSRLRSPFVLRCLDDYLAGKQASLDVAHYLT